MATPNDDKERQEMKIEEFKKQEMEDIAQILSQKYGLPYINLSLIPISIDALKIIPEEDARKGFIAAFQKVGKILKVILKNPNIPETNRILNGLKDEGYKLELFLSSDSSLKKAWGYYKDIPIYTEAKFGIVEISGEKIKELEKSAANIQIFKKTFEDHISKEKRKITEILELILTAGLNSEASDIHLEPEENDIRVRFRLDGVLVDVLTFPKEVYSYLLSRIKLVSELKLNIHDKSQDGRFSIKLENMEIEIRTSIIPGAYGETVVLRILNPKTISLNFEDLGMQKKLLDEIYREIKKPNGMILTTGPTGSGKTTAIYAFLKKVNSPEVKILTIEDPVEYHLTGISQTQVNREKNYDFANGLKAILRQDPDIIMIGEIRDYETAETAIQASLTGHLVFSTLHTNNASGTIPRLIDLGVNPNLIGPAVNFAMAQRLVRKLCPYSREKRQATEREKEIISNLIKNLPDKFEEEKTKYDFNDIWDPVPCEKCNNTGYKGRIGVFEVLKIDQNMEGLISRNSTESDFEEAAKEQGMLTMAQDGALKILNGITSFDEVERVVGF